ncbi:MAG: phytochelatin synthase [Sandaracinaceae bacterium]|jgi:hypothetical protein|nr:phytochelatin synthase [Sandaracinaceae bacterium]
MTRGKKIALGCLGVFLLAAIIFVFSARRFIFPEKLDVVSIRTESTFQNPALLQRAFALPVAAQYQRAPIAFQPNGSFCGPTSLADVWRTLGRPEVTPAQVLEGTELCATGICFGGLTLDDLAGVVRNRIHRRATVLRNLNLAQFREHLRHSNEPDRRYVLNFDRGPLFGTRGGHHSPVGGYLEGEDLVLVLDVNARFRPWLVRSARLFQAMDTTDQGTGRKRGLLLIQ